MKTPACAENVEATVIRKIGLGGCKGTGLDKLERRGLGTPVVTLYIGSGQAIATVIERV